MMKITPEKAKCIVDFYQSPLIRKTLLCPMRKSASSESLCQFASISSDDAQNNKLQGGDACRSCVFAHGLADLAVSSQSRPEEFSVYKWSYLHRKILFAIEEHTLEKGDD
jgi:hypothetical protein